jgi:hypothetical protein
MKSYIASRVLQRPQSRARSAEIVWFPVSASAVKKASVRALLVLALIPTPASPEPVKRSFRRLTLRPLESVLEDCVIRQGLGL